MSLLFAVLIILFGFVLILADLLFIPGGVVAMVGGLFIISSIVVSFKVFGKETAFLLSGGSVILAGVLAYVSVKFRLWNRFVSKGGENRESGFHSFKGGLDDKIGKQAETMTDLRPAGIVLIDGKKFDAMSEGGFITSGKKVTVVSVSTGQLKVKENP